MATVALVALLAMAAVACGATSEPTAVPDAQAAPAAAPPPAAPEATATATPPPTPVAEAPAPAASPTAEAQAASTPAPGPAAQRDMTSELADQAWTFLTMFTDEYSPRESGTDEERVAAEFLLGEFRKLGFAAELQLFEIEYLSQDAPRLSLNSPEERKITGIPMAFTGMGEATGFLADAGRAFPDEIPPGGLAGKIALIERGEIAFQQKVSRVAEAGAVAAVVYNNETGLFRGALAEQATIPAISISRKDGKDLFDLLPKGDVEVTVSVVNEERSSRNVVATKSGPEGSDKIVVLGTHFDTVPDTQGANDNGSGVATMLVIADQIKDKSFPFTLRFIAFGSEEVGLLGSRHYVDSLAPEEQKNIVAMLNFDVPGSGDVLELIGNFTLVGQVLDYANENGIPTKLGTPIPGGSSDHAPFADAEVPAIFFLADDISRINSPDDTIEFVKPELMGATAVLGLGLLDILAQQ